MNKIKWTLIAIAICASIYLAVANWEHFKILVFSVLAALGLYGGGRSALKAKKKKHQDSIKKRNKKTEETLEKISKRTSLKSRVANRNKRAKKR